MSDLLRNFHLPMIFVSVIITFQISFYFFYLYHDKKKDMLELNKILTNHHQYIIIIKKFHIIINYKQIINHLNQIIK